MSCFSLLALFASSSAHKISLDVIEPRITNASRFWSVDRCSGPFVSIKRFVTTSSLVLAISTNVAEKQPLRLHNAQREVWLLN